MIVEYDAISICSEETTVISLLFKPRSWYKLRISFPSGLAFGLSLNSQSFYGS
jgi:hypothetical protein